MALQFSGTSSYLENTTAITFGGALSVEFWLYLPSASGSDYHILAIHNGISLVDAVVVGITSGRNIFVGNASLAGAQFTAYTVPLTTWVHVACTVSATGSANLYVNGLQKANLTMSVIPSKARGTIWWGKSAYNVTTVTMLASLKEMRVWNSERSASDISTNFNSSLPTGTLLLISLTSDTVANSTTSTLLDTAGNRTFTMFAVTRVNDLGVPTGYNPSSWTFAIDKYKNANKAYSGVGSLDATSFTKSQNNTYPTLIVPTLNYQQSFTIECFVYPQRGTTVFNVGQGAGENNNTLIHLFSTVYRGLGGVLTQATGATTVALNTWTHVAISYDATTNKVYNAIKGTVASATLSAALTFSTGQPINFFWRNDTANDYYETGYIDSIRVSQSCIYTAAYTVPDPTTWSAGGTTLFVENFEPILLQRYTFNGTLAGTGSLALALQNTATTLGTPTYTTGPVAGTQSLVIPDTNFLRLPYSSFIDFDASMPFSIGGWFNVTSFPNSNAHFMSTWSSTNTSTMDYFLNNSGMYLFCNGVFPGFAFSTALLNRWVHVWVVYNGTTLSVYENGTSRGQANVSPIKGTTPWTINRSEYYPTQTAPMQVSDVKWYSGVYPAGLAMGIIASAVTVDTVALTGTVSLTVSGGTGTYSYAWQKNGIAGFSTAQNLTGLAPATYTCAITSGPLTQTVTATVNVVQPLQRYSFNGTLAGDGMLNLALQNTATTLGTPAYTAGPLPGTQALSIPTLLAYVQLPFHASLNFSNAASFSFGGWFYMQTSTGYPYHMSNTNGTAGIELFARNDAVPVLDCVQVFSAGAATYVYSGTLPSMLGRWIHRWVTFNGTTMTLYHNGAQIAAMNVPSINFSTTQAWNICRSARNADGTQRMTGAVADVRWYGQVVNPAEIVNSAIYASVATVDTLALSGSVTLTVIGGTGTYSYAWQKNGIAGFSTAQNLTGLAPATYTCVITSGTLTQTVTATVNVVQPLQRYSFNGTLVGDGSLGLALQDTATTLGTPAYTAGPVAGTQALSIAANKYLQLAPSAGLSFTVASTFSMGGWFYFASGSSDIVHLISNYGPGTDKNGLDWQLYYAGTNSCIVTTDQSRSINNEAVSPSAYNRWMHFWLTYDGPSKTMTTYFNGVKKSAVNAGTQTFTSTSPWRIFNCASRLSEVSIGNVADVRWYTGIVSPQDILYPPTLLQQYTFNGTLAGTGSLALALQNTATTLGTPAYTTGPLSGTQALSLPTFLSYLQLPFHTALQFSNAAPFSFGGWFYMSSKTGQVFSFSNSTGGSGATGIEVLTDSGNPPTIDYIQAMSNNGAYYNGGTVASMLNRWIHKWVIFNGTNMVLYHNGTQIASQALTVNVAATQPWLINAVVRYSPGANAMTGSVADVRWYSGVVAPVTAMNPVYALSATATSTNSAGSSGTITLTVSGSTAYTYAWSKDGVPGFSTAQNLTGLAPGTYVCTVASGGQTVTASATLTYVPPAFGSAVAINSNNLVIGAKTWSQKVDTPILGCGAMYVYTKAGTAWNQVMLLAPNTTYSTAGGMLGNSVSLNNTHIVGGGQLLATSTAYTGAAAFKQVWFNVAGVITNVAYFGLKNGSISAPIVAFGTPPHTYKWSDNPAVTTATRSSIGAGTYVQTISSSDLPAQTMSYTYVVTQPDALQISLTHTNCSAYDVTDGSITGTGASGGTGIITYRWNTAATTPSLSSIGAGDYTLTLTDALGYTASWTVTVTEPQLKASATSSTPVTADVSWDTTRALNSTAAYQVDYVNPDGSVVKDYLTTAGSSLTIRGLKPATTYTVRIYKVLRRGVGDRKPLATLTVTTQPDVVVNYSKQSFLTAPIGTTPVYSIDRLSTELYQNSNLDLNQIFQTAELVQTKTRVLTTYPSSIVNLSTTLTVDKLRSVILPFKKELGPGQQITVKETQNNLTKVISYDHITGKVHIDDMDYTNNSVLRIPGRYRVRL